MSFEKGKVSFQVMKAGQRPEDCVELMQQRALPELRFGWENPTLSGWVGFRHALDRELSADNTVQGGYFFAGLSTAGKKIPPGLFDAECRKREQAVSGAVSGAIRKEIADDVKLELLPQMPWSPSAKQFVWLDEEPWLFSESLSVADVSDFQQETRATFGTAFDLPEPMDPHGLAWSMMRDVRSWTPVCFCGQQEMFCESAGQEFLMWLWFRQCQGKSAWEMEPGRHVVVGLNGSVTLVGSDDNSTAIKHLTLRSKELWGALQSGQCLRKSGLLVALGEDKWECTFDAALFTFKGMSLPETESFARADKFAERVVHIGRFWELFRFLFRTFCDLRVSDEWPEVEERMRAWVMSSGRSAEKVGSPVSERSAPARTAPAVPGTSKGEGPTVELSFGHGHEYKFASVAEFTTACEAAGDDATLLTQAISVIRETKRASALSLQHRLKVGYNRASMIMDQLEAYGLVGPAKDGGPRDLFLPEEGAE